MRKLAVIGLVMLGVAPSLVRAGVYTDDMSKCLVEATSKDERIALVQWIFAAMAQHPAVAKMTTVKPADVEKANAATGALFMKLLTERCVDTTKKAIRYEGSAAIQMAFQVLGQVASRDIFTDPAVLKVMDGLEKHTDPKKLEALKK